MKFYKDIWEENADFTFEKEMYSPEFFTFFNNILAGANETLDKLAQ
jgi:hypothetical protein